MSRLAWVSVAVFCSAISMGCGGGDNDGDDGQVDAAVQSSCNPVAQTGCEAGEKCSQLIETVGAANTPLFRTACVPNGDKAIGAACSFGQPGATTGFDDCAAGGVCIDGVCDTICAVGPPVVGCEAGDVCDRYVDFFDDIEGEAAGVCAKTCDPIAQDCEDVTDGCTLNPSTGVGSCSGVPPTMGGQDDPCLAQGENCVVNGCEKGYFPVWLPPDTAPAGAVRLCAAFCSPVNTYGGITPAGNDAGDVNGILCDAAGNAAGGQGVGAQPYTCRYLQTVFDNRMIPATIGVCNSSGYVERGLCSTWDIEAFVAAFTPGTIIENYCRVGNAPDGEIRFDLCPSGCVSFDYLDSRLPTASARQAARAAMSAVITEEARLAAAASEERISYPHR